MKRRDFWHVWDHGVFFWGAFIPKKSYRPSLSVLRIMGIIHEKSLRYNVSSFFCSFFHDGYFQAIAASPSFVIQTWCDENRDVGGKGEGECLHCVFDG